MTWAWKTVVKLNKVICEASGLKHGVKLPPTKFDEENHLWTPAWIARTKPFLAGNNKTAAALAALQAFEN
jgi:hypothetical protein